MRSLTVSTVRTQIPYQFRTYILVCTINFFNKGNRGIVAETVSAPALHFPLILAPDLPILPLKNLKISLTPKFKTVGNTVPVP